MSTVKTQAPPSELSRSVRAKHREFLCRARSSTTKSRS